MNSINSFFGTSESIHLLIFGDKLALFNLGLSLNQEKVGVQGLNAILVSDVTGFKGGYELVHFFSDSYKSQILTVDTSLYFASLHGERLSGLRS